VSPLNADSDHDGVNDGAEVNEKYQLTTASSATSAVEYSYDVLGRRTEKVSVLSFNLFD